jgi:hypothetical protein
VSYQLTRQFLGSEPGCIRCGFRSVAARLDLMTVIYLAVVALFRGDLLCEVQPAARWFYRIGYNGDCSWSSARITDPESGRSRGDVLYASGRLNLGN